MIVSLCWTFVTIGTVGYGDYSPQTNIGMFFAISVIVFGIGSFAIAIEAIVDFLLTRQQMRLMELINVKKNRACCNMRLKRVPWSVLKKLEGKMKFL